MSVDRHSLGVVSTEVQVSLQGTVFTTVGRMAKALAILRSGLVRRGVAKGHNGPRGCSILRIYRATLHPLNGALAGRTL